MINLFRISEILKRTCLPTHFFALTRQQLKTENNKLNICTQYLMKSTFETIWLFFSQARRTCGTTHFIRLCTILHATDYRLISKTVEGGILYYFCPFVYTPAPQRVRGYTVLPLSVCPSVQDIFLIGRCFRIFSSEPRDVELPCTWNLPDK
jgi:hypothetical protein